MHCTNCGYGVQPGTRFCANCGSNVVDPDATQVMRTQTAMRETNQSLQESERTIFTMRPTIIFITTGYVMAGLGAIVITIILAYIGLSAPISLLLALLLLLIPAFYHLKRNMILYTLTDSRLEINQGFLRQVTRNVPLHKIQDVTVSATILQRLLGFGDLIIENASEYGGVTVLRHVRNPRYYADLILKELRRW
jgi:membrane protein YdbS with pleckstrin-like domain